jgi:hypothetical protein
VKLIRCEGYIPRLLEAKLRVCTLMSQILYENNHTPSVLRRGWLIFLGPPVTGLNLPHNHALITRDRGKPWEKRL